MCVLFLSLIDIEMKRNLSCTFSFLVPYFEPVMSIDVGNEKTSMILRDLEPLVVYKITVAAISNQGPGPKGVTFGGRWR